MNKLFKLFLFLALPLLSVLAVSCGDDDDDVVQPLAPEITAVSPSEGLPGTVVTITGTNLREVTSVRFGSTDAQGFNASSNTATTITATVPAGIAAGAQTITVTSPGGSDTFSFTVLEEQNNDITITSFSPTSGPVGTEVTIEGTNFSDAGIASISMGDMDIADYTVGAGGTTITFAVPEGAQTGTITITPTAGDPVVSTGEFTVTTEGNAGTLTTYADIVVNAQGNRNDEGVVTAFSAEGETFTLQQGTDAATSEKIDFIAADSGGDDELDLFSPAGNDWLTGNYFEDADDQPVVWPTMNETRMMVVEGMDQAGFEAATAEEVSAMSVGEDFTLRVQTPDPGVVILFETADGKKGLMLWKAHDPNADAGTKADIFTFDIRVLE